MKIGLVTYDFYPPIGGQGVIAYGLYRALNALEGVEVTVVSASANDLPGHVRVPADAPLIPGQFLFSARLLRQLRSIVHEQRLDLLQVYGGPGGVALQCRPEVPLVYVANHTYAQQYKYMGNRAYRALMAVEARGYHIADSIVAVSSATAASLTKDYEVPPWKIHVIPNGVDFEAFKPLGLAKIPGSILYAGRLCERKGLPLLLEAFKDLAGTIPDSRLFIIGEGELREGLEDLALRLGVSERVVFLGKVSREELVEWYNKVEVFVLPSLFEGFGIVCLEAMACGTPVIASRAPGITDVIEDGRNGILVERDREELLSALSRVLRDHGLRSALGSQGRRDAIERFGWESVVDRFVELYEELASQGCDVARGAGAHSEYDCGYFESLSGRALLKGRKPFYHGYWARHLHRRLRSGKILDLGCGTGFFLRRAQRYFATYGVDISPWAVGQASRIARGSDLHVADAASLDFSDSFFDAVTCFDILEHIEEPQRAIAESARVLKSGGLIVASVPNMDSIGRTWKKEAWFAHRDETHVSLLSNESWRSLLDEGGFDIVNTRYDGLWDTPYFSRVPPILQKLILKLPSVVLFVLGVRFPRRLGENICLVAVKR